MEFRFCSLLHPHTLCHLSLHSGHCLELSGSVTESTTAWQLSLLHADSGKKRESVLPPSPLYHHNPSIICYIAYYLHDNWCLIFYPSTSRRKEVFLRVSGCMVYVFFYCISDFLLPALGTKPPQTIHTETKYIGEEWKRCPFKKIKHVSKGATVAEVWRREILFYACLTYTNRTCP